MRILYTNAPESYDYNMETIQFNLGWLLRGTPLRMLIYEGADEGRIEYQIGRNRSGLYIADETLDWIVDEIKLQRAREARAARSDEDIDTWEVPS